MAADGPQLRRLRRQATLLGAVVALAGCGTGAEPARTTLDATWTLPDPSWQTGDGAALRDRGLKLAAEGKGDTGVVVAPKPVAAQASSETSASVILPGPWGAAGISCRSDADLSTGYAFVVSRAGGWWLFRYDDGVPAEITNGGIDPDELPPEEPVRLQLACAAGEEDGTTVLRFAYAERQPITVTDRSEASGTRSGFLVTEQLDIDRDTAGMLKHFALRAK